MYKSFMEFRYRYIPWNYNLELNFVAQWIANFKSFSKMGT